MTNPSNEDDPISLRMSYGGQQRRVALNKFARKYTSSARHSRSCPPLDATTNRFSDLCSLGVGRRSGRLGDHSDHKDAVERLPLEVGAD